MDVGTALALRNSEPMALAVLAAALNSARTARACRIALGDFISCPYSTRALAAGERDARE